MHFIKLYSLSRASKNNTKNWKEEKIAKLFYISKDKIARLFYKRKKIIINFDEVTRENRLERNPDLPDIPNHPYRILIEGDWGTGKTNA